MWNVDFFSKLVDFQEITKIFFWIDVAVVVISERSDDIEFALQALCGGVYNFGAQTAY